MNNEVQQIIGNTPGSILLSGGIIVEPDDEFQQWKREYKVKIGEHDAYPDQQLLIWYANKGNGQLIPPFGPMPAGIKLKVIADKDSNGKNWNAIINGMGTFDAHTSIIHHWNLSYTGHSNRRLTQIVISKQN